ncbi:MAG TPA: SulP family inorganic anion transporter [Burkholderiaceae bacterium]|jgi:SulP family sulfate permease
MINIVEAYKARLLGKGNIIPNVVAGVIVGVVALPLAMAFAIASGARPEQGLYTAIVAGFLVSALGGSRAQIAGPTGAFVAILLGITTKYGIDGLQIATFMAGLMLLVVGVAKIGGVIRFIPAPVIMGFTAGVGVIIWVGQWPYFFGLPAARGLHFHEKLLSSLEALPHLHPATTVLGMASLLLVVFSNRIPGMKRVPGPLVAMVAISAAQALFHFDGVATIGSTFGGIPHQLPGLSFPTVTLARVIELVGPAFTIAMLGAIESLLSAVVADGMAGTRHDSNQELIGQGIANMVAPMFGGFAATGAIARTATNIRNGGNSPLAGMVHALTLLLTILVFAPLANDIPLAALGAILFVVAFNMSEIRHFASMVTRAPRADVAILLITFLLTVFADLVVAVNIGVILATMQFLRRMASSVEVNQQTHEHLSTELAEHGWPSLPPGVLVYGIEGPFFFGAVENFERSLAQSHTDPGVLILRLLRVPFIDMTGLLTLEEVVKKLQRRGVRVILCEANERVRSKLAKAGLLQVLGESNYADTFPQTLSKCRSKDSVPATPAQPGVERRKKSRTRINAEQLLKISRDYFLGTKS